MRIRKSTIRAVGIVLVLLLLGVAAGIVVAAGDVNIATTPLHVQQSVYRDVDFDGIHDPEELIGVFDVYDGNHSMEFSWGAYPFAEGVNGSYRVSLVQNTTPLGASATWSEVVIGHHWASNPNGTNYVMGPFNHNTVCTDCPSHFLIIPETYEQVYNAAADRYDYQYTPVAAALGGATASNLEESDDFIIEIFYVAPDACDGGSPNCNNACSSYENCVKACKNAPGCDPNVACYGPIECFAACNTGEFNVCGDGGGGGGGCQDAWATFCEAVTDTEEEYFDCLSFYPIAEAEGFCQECGDDPLSCVGG